ncbi:myb/SANT-like DNA-binding domain-containing protein 3 [Procambarus clarkii]|uniref:myb/SANT-like DNA-binding domain-containing protein 3 n=1 Tax=Procambarus clarkii TaxID=6728 RepID=UPI001E67478B|nr:myb/SANT-like DNA-binding domain-containing protein 3 [Procambarus clarkii]
MAEYGEGTEGRRKWFIPLEKTVLTALIEQHKDVVESKKRDGASNREKEQVWEVIAAQFSAHPSTQPRSSRELRRCWENMKARAKKALENDRGTRNGSEDNRSLPSSVTPEVEAVLNVLNPYDDVKNVVVNPQDMVPDCLMPETSTNSAVRMDGFQTGQSSASDTSQNCEQTSYYEKPNSDLTPNIGPSRRTRKQKMDQLCDEDILLAQMQMQQAQLSIENLRLERKTLQEKYQQQREAHEWQRQQHEANLNLAMLQIKFWEKKTGYGDMET